MRVVLGQSARRFLPSESSKLLVLAGMVIDGHEGLMDISDGDVVFQALCQALGSVFGFSTLLKIGKELIEKDGITDSVVLLERCLNQSRHLKITQVSFSIEAKGAALFDHIEKMQESTAKHLHLTKDRVAIAVYEGCGLSDVSCGDGIHVMCALTLQDQ